MRPLLTSAAIAATLLAGCAAPQPQVYNAYPASHDGTTRPEPGAYPQPVAAGTYAPVMSMPTMYPVNDLTAYLLDPTSRSCTLIRSVQVGSVFNPVAVPVDCATIAANNRDLAAMIFWVQPAPVPAAPVAPPSAAR